MNEIKFSHNWNNKLDCKAFTTLRLRNDLKYHVGQEYDIILQEKGKPPVTMPRCQISSMRHIKIEQINEFISQLDTGYSRTGCINMIKTMYKNKNINWETQQLSFILLVKIK